MDGIALESQTSSSFSHGSAIEDARGVVATFDEMSRHEAVGKYTATEPSHRRGESPSSRVALGAGLENLYL